MLDIKFEDRICILCGVFTFGLVLEVVSLLFDIVSLFACGNLLILVSVVLIINELIKQLRQYEDKYGKMEL